tara:strand:- start:134 stop:784 length:651 start_codon:yes stop_codon:yes gene_type:complete
MKLVYFNGRGLAETSRLIFAYNQVSYEDFRYPLHIRDWKTHDMTKEEFDSDKNAGKLVSSLHKVPFLEVNGSVICQSKAIERYLGRRYNMMGDSELEAGLIDSICEVVRDIKDMYQKVRRLPEEEKEAGLQEWFSVTMPNKFSDLEHILGEDGYSVGGRASLADIVLFSLVTQFFDNKEGAMNATSNTPRLRSIVQKIADNENIKLWLESRPVTAF